MKQFELERKKLQAAADQVRAEAEEMAAKIAATPVEITVRVGEGDKLYGSVTPTHIADAMAEQGVEIDRRKIVLEEPIRALGEFDIEIKLHPDVRGELKLTVAKKGGVIEEPFEEVLDAEEEAEEASEIADAETE